MNGYLTLSEAQAKWLQARGDPRLVVIVQNWADHAPPEPYDAILCMGALEHVVRFGETTEAKVQAYRTFFRRAHSLLRPGGRIALQTIVKGGRRLDEEGVAGARFIVRRIFPGSDVPTPAEIALAADGLLEVVTLRNDRLQYARTCREWLARLTRNRVPAVGRVGEQVVRRYERYLATFVRFFEMNHLGLHRYVLERVDP